MTNNSALIQIVTWNDFGEGTIVEPTQEHGYQNLGAIQDFRRQYLDSAFAYHTNDLPLAMRLYNLRRQYPSNAIVSAELDRVFTNIVSGDLTKASLQLTGVESNRPVIYNLSFSNGQLQFSVGGYISAAGIGLQTSSNATLGGWQTINTLSASTNRLTFSTPVLLQNTAAYFRIQNNGP
jgi:hypothetical protein